jgi:hypothetical protein
VSYGKQGDSVVSLAVTAEVGLDDYQDASLEMADWSPLAGHAVIAGARNPVDGGSRV